MSALGKAIMAKLAGTTLNTSIGGRMFEGRADIGTPVPFVVFYAPSTGQVDRVFDQTRVRFSIFSDAVTADDIEVDVLEQQLLAVYRDCTLSGTGLNGNCGLEKPYTVRIPPGDSGVRQTAIDFLIWIER